MADRQAGNLRQRAEEQLKKEQSKRIVSDSEAELNKLIHELQVHEIELKMQNEELLEAKTAAGKAAEKYSKLYDFAPTGYFIISKKGEITELNLSAAAIIGKERSYLINRQLGFFISSRTRPVYNQFIEQVFESNGLVTCELEVSGNKEKPVYVLVTGTVVQKGGDCFLTMADVTERKRNEQELKNAYSQLKLLYHYQDEIKENERKAISRLIHDELGQSLSALKIDLGWTKDNVGEDASVIKKITGMTDIVNNTIKTVQQISSELRPGLLDDLGLVATIEWYCQEFKKRTAIECHLNLEEIELDDERINTAFYRILQEALTNVMRHAKAKNVTIKFSKKKDKVSLVIEDDGKGFLKDKINSYKSLGILGIKERVRQLNGTLDITSTIGKGTLITIIFPFS